jgi:prepilin-type processing-associated H-X9-DG protein
MNRLTQEQQQYILDFYFRCADQEEIEVGRDLIASSTEAAKLYADLESSLTDLDHIKYDACPDNLVDLTIARLKLAASGTRTPNNQLHQLLEQERLSISQTRPTPVDEEKSSRSASGRSFLRPVFEIFAAAASIALVAGILFPGLGAFRAHSRQVACERNLGRIGAAFASFAQDNHDRLSEARVKAGSPWWKIGMQGQETESNTRYPFMLVKQGYVDGKVFVCKGYKHAHPFTAQASKMAQLNDFPSRDNITYSFTLFCNENLNPLTPSRKIIASDLNPIFVSVFKKISSDPGFYQQMTDFEKVLLNEQLKEMMSQNHRGRGQNVLYCDGSVEYIQERIVNGDDIFTVNGVNAYTGRETPTDQNDTFLAP